ncbi:hypothetical protein SDC9_130852 [bioreactor metagenome]|uniref:Uncharacterized protein n=1 Tax=bioreactor metagenome TaxID=1076179 RepID=A0A645D3U5_9ZZZZ
MTIFKMGRQMILEIWSTHQIFKVRIVDTTFEERKTLVNANPIVINKNIAMIIIDTTAISIRHVK